MLDGPDEAVGDGASHDERYQARHQRSQPDAGIHPCEQIILQPAVGQRVPILDDQIAHVDAVDFNAEMCLSEDYDGIRSGVTFRVDVNRVSGACITNATPENYGPECWVPRDDKAAVSERLAILENLDPESVLRLL